MPRQASASRTRNPSRENANPQCGLALSDSRPTSTAQLTGLNAATSLIQGVTSVLGMSRVDRNDIGSTKNVTAAIIDSSLRMMSPSASEKVANAAPSSSAATTS